jgi:hypothetical protein
MPASITHRLSESPRSSRMQDQIKLPPATVDSIPGSPARIPVGFRRPHRYPSPQLRRNRDTKVPCFPCLSHQGLISILNRHFSNKAFNHERVLPYKIFGGISIFENSHRPFERIRPCANRQCNLINANSFDKNDSRNKRSPPFFL